MTSPHTRVPPRIRHDERPLSQRGVRQPTLMDAPTKRRAPRTGLFWDKVQKTDSCWNWIAALNAYGYGVIRRDGKVRFAHRLAYEELVGPIPEGLQIDHLCRNHACVNPAHMEAVTQRINLLRGNTITARNAAATHCPKGHPYSPENTYDYPYGRFCKTCKRESERVRRIRQKEVRHAA